LSKKLFLSSVPINPHAQRDYGHGP